MIFRKQNLQVHKRPSNYVPTTVVVKSRTLEKDGRLTQFDFFDSIRIDEVDLHLPQESDYKLDVMLKEGYKPSEVNVNGLLDSNDVLDYDTESIISSSLSKLRDFEQSSAPAEPAAPAASAEPAEPVEPTE